MIENFKTISKEKILVQSYGYENGVEGYTDNELICDSELADKLVRVNNKLRPIGMEIVVMDAYRPAMAQYSLYDESVASASSTIKPKSKHNTGFCVDLTIKNNSNTEYDKGIWNNIMGSFYTMKGKGKYRPNNRYCSFLRGIMMSEGLVPKDDEWWHFQLKGNYFPQDDNDFLANGKIAG